MLFIMSASRRRKCHLWTSVRHLIFFDEFLGVATDSCCLIHVYRAWLLVVGCFGICCWMFELSVNQLFFIFVLGFASGFVRV